MAGLVAAGAVPASRAGGGGGGRGRGEEEWLATPVVPDDILREAVPGNIRRAEHFVAFLQRFVAYLAGRLGGGAVAYDTPDSFLAHLQAAVAMDGKTLRFCYDRLASLLKTLEISATDDYGPVQRVADFATLVGTYSQGFAIIMEPYDERLPSVREGASERAAGRGLQERGVVRANGLGAGAAGAVG